MNYDDLYFDGGKRPGPLQPVRGGLQPRRLHHQGQAVVLRLVQPDLQPDGGPEGFQGTATEDPFCETFKTKNNGLGRVHPAHRPLPSPACACPRASSTASRITGGPSPASLGDEHRRPTDWAQEGYDYPNKSASLTADYSVGNNLLISYRGGWHEQDTTNEQIAPPDASYYSFGTSNSAYARDPFFVEQSGPDPQRRLDQQPAQPDDPVLQAGEDQQQPGPDLLPELGGRARPEGRHRLQLSL